MFTVSSLGPLLFMAISLVYKVSKNLSSFPTGYNWVNQICNHDRARNVTFNEKFHYIRHDKPESKTHGPSFPCGMWPPWEAAEDLLPGLQIPIQPLRLQKKLLLSALNTDKRGFCKKKSPLSLQVVQALPDETNRHGLRFLILDNILGNFFTPTDSNDDPEVPRSLLTKVSSKALVSYALILTAIHPVRLCLLIITSLQWPMSRKLAKLKQKSK